MKHREHMEHNALEVNIDSIRARWRECLIDEDLSFDKKVTQNCIA